jgi:long-chain acyl-CoA synthetase
MGYLDDEGFLVITGRIKEQYKLENGKYVVPVPIEESIKLSPRVANVMVHGANKPFNVAVIVPEPEGLKKWAAEKGLAVDPYAQLLQHADVKRLFLDEISKFTQEIKGFEKVRDVLIVADDFTIDNDMLTPSMKLKRRSVLARYGESLDALYKNASGGAD